MALNNLSHTEACTAHRWFLLFSCEKDILERGSLGVKQQPGMEQPG